MNSKASPDSEKPAAKFSKPWHSGVLLASAGFLTGIGNYIFQGIIGRQLSQGGEYGLANSALIFTGLLSLPLAIASAAVAHYIARFHFSGDDARLKGLLGGCRKFLFRLTIAGSIAVVVLLKPLSDFFHFPRMSLVLAALVSVLAGLWGSFATALCQGLGWFKRLAFIGLFGVGLRLIFCIVVSAKFPVAETAVLASAVALLSNGVLLFWRKELARPAESVSPWTREFVFFLIVSTSCIGGGFLFLQGDILVAQKYFSGAEKDAYAAAERLAVALPMLVAPLLTVLFTHRSGAQSKSAAREQMKLLGLYAAGLSIGAVCLLLLKGFCVKLIFGRPNPEAAGFVGPLALTMIFVGLLQAQAMWALASRWLKISLLYGVLGASYWGVLLCKGLTVDSLLNIMPWVAGIACTVMFICFSIALRKDSEL